MEPLVEFIRRCVAQRRIAWTYHSSMRMKDRSIAREDVLESCADLQIVEEYPAEQRLPSCLCLGCDRGGQAFHCVIAVDREGGRVHLVTAYRPDPAKWEAGFRKRK